MVNWASVYGWAYLGNFSYDTNQNSPSPRSGNVVCKGKLNSMSLSSVFWIPYTGSWIGGFYSPNEGTHSRLGPALQETRNSTAVKVDWQPYAHQMGHNWWRFKKQIWKVLCQNKVRKAHMMKPPPDIQLLRATTFNHFLTGEWFRLSPYELVNLKGNWEQQWKASQNVRETPGLWMHE